MARLDLRDGHQGGFGGGGRGLQREAREVGHAGDFDEGLQGEVGGRVGIVVGERVRAGPWFDGGRADVCLEDAQVAGFVVADFEQAGVGAGGEAGGCEGLGREAGDALLVEGEDYLFGCEQVLKEEVVWGWGGGGYVEGCAGDVAGPGGSEGGEG